MDVGHKKIQFGQWLQLTQSGTTPHVALGLNAALEVHQVPKSSCIFLQTQEIKSAFLQENQNQLCYRLGILQGSEKKIEWDKYNLFDSGNNPSVSTGGSDFLKAIVVYESNQKPSIACNIGRLSLANMNIRWNGMNVFGNGNSPQIAINTKGVVLEIHQAAGNSDLFYDVSYILPCIVESVAGVGVSTDPNKR